MSSARETPGPARGIAWPSRGAMRGRVARYVRVTAGLEIRKAWAATIDYTPDHLPILGPALEASGTEIRGAVVASAGGHGMMWGPAVARLAADLVLTGST